MKEQSPRTYPPPVTVVALRKHFADKYQFDEQQVELMVQSSRDSLQAVFVRFTLALDGKDVDFEELSRIGHSLKGLFLNLGEGRWADIARDLERGARQQQDLHYTKIAQNIREGVQEILNYGKT